jgi:FAD/FMN-containing dehydrogenase
VWQTFNASINGLLIPVQPSAAVCYSNPPNVNACTIATTQWSNSTWRSDQAGAMQNTNWENSSCFVNYNSATCNQGSVPILAVNATLPEHVQATIQFANTYNLRLVMKTTGHDYLGRSTAAGSFLLWLHYMKNKTLIDNFSLCTGENISNAIRVGAGVQWGEVYAWLAPYNLIAIGGASGTVGSAGGYLQGGGHGPLSRWKGLAVDQVLEFDVIMANGSRETVNACENSDLFWALRGGGGGTFAVVLSVVLRTYSSPSIIFSLLAISAPNKIRYNSFVDNFVQLLPTLQDVGWAGYFYIVGTSFTSSFLIPNGDINVANATISQLTSNYSDFSITSSILYPFTSFYDYYITVLAPSNPTGFNVLLGSRLIPETIVSNQPDQVADAFIQANDGGNTELLGHLVAGGQVSNTTQNSSVNPGWRTALLHMVYAQSWPDGTLNEVQETLAQHVTQQVQILQTVAGGSQSTAYMNEADPNEPDWQQKFFGTMDNYNQLKSIKDTVDPNGLFVCKNCVGSDDWSEDLNCPITSNANKFDIAFKLSLFIGIYYLLFLINLTRSK